jgi:Tfp pilus assembly protein PilF
VRHRTCLLSRALTCALLCALLTACAHAPQPVPQPPDHLFEGASFAAPSEAIDAAAVMALNEPMRHYLRTAIAPKVRTRGRQAALVEALYQRDMLRLEYDAVMTRTASQAFEARAGNCLSLVIMTAAFAREMGLQVTFQSAYREESWSRSGDLLFRSGHVNVTLGRRLADAGSPNGGNDLTIDFLPPEQIRGLRTVPIAEARVLAMYMNNRAAEALAQGRLDDAHAWARESIRQDPSFLGAYNTLGVIYLNHGDAQPAERVFRHVLAREPAHTLTLANLAQALAQMGRQQESQALLGELERLDPHPPFHFFNLGMAAMRRGDFRSARELFTRETARDGSYHEFQFWLAVANYRLGDEEQARRHLDRALAASTTRKDHDLYAAKLDWMRARQQP